MSRSAEEIAKKYGGSIIDEALAKYGGQEVSDFSNVESGFSTNTKPFVSGESDIRNMPATGADASTARKILSSLIPGLRFAQIATSPNPLREAALTTQPSIMSEGAKEVLTGNALSGTGAAVKQTLSDITSSGNPQYTAGQKIVQALLGAVKTPMEIENIITGGAKELIAPGSTKTPAPGSPEWIKAQRASGALLTSAELPNVASGAAIAAKAGITGLGRLIQKGVVNPPIVNRWMGIKPGDVTHGANPGQQLLDDNLLGSTKEATLAKIKPEMDQLGKTLDTQLAAGDARGLTYDAKAIVNKRFSELLNKGVIRTSDKAFRKKILNIQDNISAKLQNQGLNWQSLSPSGVHKLKVEIGDSIDWTGVPAEDAINRSLMKIYGDLNTPLKADIPQLGANLERWGNLRLAQKGLQSGVAKDVVGQGTGTIAGVAAKRIAKGAAIAGTGTYVANKIRAALD